MCFAVVRLMLTSLQTDLNPDPNSLPFILQRLDRDGSVLKGPPGYQVCRSYEYQKFSHSSNWIYLSHLFF